MKKSNYFKIAFLFIILIFISSCNNAQKEKELELKERELELKERELNLKADANPKPNIKINPKKIAERKFLNYAHKIEESKGAVIANSEVFVGDINYDDLDDAVVWFALTPAGGGNMLIGEGMSVYINVGNDMKVISGFEPDYMFKVIKISNNRIKITKQEYSKDDLPGWPSIETVKYLMLSGNHIMESNEN